MPAHEPSAVAVIAEALAERFTSGYGHRNPDWDIDGPRDDTNPLYLPVPMSERVKEQPWVVEPASDGHNFIRAASIPEITDVAVTALEAAGFVVKTREEIAAAWDEGYDAGAVDERNFADCAPNPHRDNRSWRTGIMRYDIETLLGDVWDDGNATGLDGWVGPGRGTEPVDQEAVHARERSVAAALAKLAATRNEALDKLAQFSNDHGLTDEDDARRRGGPR